MLRHTTGDILKAPVDALVNTVNCVGVMGKGLALQFKRAFPEASRAYIRDAKAGRVVPGRIHVQTTGRLDGPRFVLGFPTKRHWRSRSRLEDIDAGLTDLVRVVREYGIRSVAVPPLGAGLGGLDWSEVRSLIEERLGDLQDVEVLVFEPRGAPDPERQVVRTKRPPMTEVRALLVDAMARYRVLGESLTLLEAQKLAYFLEVAGAPLDLRFARQQYGPYSDRLFHALRDLEGHYLRGIADRTPGQALDLMDEGIDVARRWLEGHVEAAERAERVGRLIEGFESPLGMELLATVHWVCAEDDRARREVERCVSRVRAWNARKRDLMTPRYIGIAWQRLQEEGWLGRALERGERELRGATERRP